MSEQREEIDAGKLLVDLVTAMTQQMAESLGGGPEAILGRTASLFRILKVNCKAKAEMAELLKGPPVKPRKRRHQEER